MPDDAVTEDREPIDTLPPRAPGHASAPRVRTLLVCDLVDSTALVERLGDIDASDLMRRHDRLARDLLPRHNGREIDKTDGFLALFERPIEAVAFALAYQRALRTLGDKEKQTLRARVGVHVGEVVVWENNALDIAGGAKRLDVEGLAKPVVSRLMTLALPGQIILSGIAFSLAQRAERELDAPATVRWLTHGRYRFKGVAAPILVHEVGEIGVAPLQAPPSGAKAQKEVPLWRKPGVIALEAIALLIAIAVPIVLTLRAPPAIAFGERDWIVMGELRNLTGESVLDESLSTAFRISLEQSRYVNVLSDLKLRDALARMQRPEDTAIDRAVASEIAIREGARAVILPTVAEIGGRVRVSAEVIDPHTQTTVYAESADGVGAASALDSIDSVTHELRAKLGEALAAIEQDSAPLPQVTSKNLDALRAYAIGYKTYLRGDFREALGMYQQALSLDPEFSQAHVGIARVHLAGDNLAEARRYLTAALTHRERLPSREILYAEAFAAVVEYRADMLDRWRTLISVYPDFHPSYYNYALYAWSRENLYSEAVEVAQGGLEPKNPAFGPLHYLLGTLELGSERYAVAMEHLGRARALGGDASRRVWAEAYAAQRDFVRAAEAVQGFKRSGLASNDVFGYITTAALAADQGDLVAALSEVTKGSAEAEAAGVLYVRIFDGIALSLRELTETTDNLRPLLAAFIETETQASTKDDLAQRPHASFALAWAAAMAARLGERELAAHAVAAARASMADRRHPIVTQMIAVAQAQIASSEGDHKTAFEALDGIETDQALLAARALEIELLAQTGQYAKARARAEALAAARGRAYTEYDSYNMLRPRKVAEANLAVLRGAELALADGDREAAARSLNRFEQLWPAAKLPAPLRERIRALRAGLDGV